jgi:hypothetical protein
VFTGADNANNRVKSFLYLCNSFKAKAAVSAMHKFPINNYNHFSELPLDVFNTFKFSIYIIDFDWNYLFVNDFVKENLKDRAEGIIGRNMWKTFPELAADSSFGQMREKLEQRISHSFVTTSPLTSHRLYISGYPLNDCFYFSSSILPDKEELLSDIRKELSKRK